MVDGGCGWWIRTEGALRKERQVEEAVRFLDYQLVAVLDTRQFCSTLYIRQVKMLESRS
jgi:hypothetical protein